MLKKILNILNYSLVQRIAIVGVMTILFTGYLLVIGDYLGAFFLFIVGSFWCIGISFLEKKRRKNDILKTSGNEIKTN